MTLTLYLHPLSSYCHKALIAFYENGIAFEAKRVDDPAVNAELAELSPVRKFPLLRDDRRGETVMESSIIVEYLDLHHPGPLKLVPAEPGLALKVREADRFFDNYLHAPMQKFAFDNVRPADQRDAYGRDEARRLFATALGVLERKMQGRSWAVGEAFTLADCAAAPPLFFGNRFVLPFRTTHPNCTAYLDRLMARPSYARCLAEAEPFFPYLPELETQAG